jgi:hypothetical protein
MTLDDSFYDWGLYDGAAAALTTQQIVQAGVAPSYTAAGAGGDSFVPGQRTFLHLKNGGGASVTVTIPAPSFGTFSITPLSITVSAGGEKLVGPFPPDLFLDSTTGNCPVSYSGVTSVTVAVLSLAKF